ncbi:hypothetical protein C3Y94_025875 [Rhizobium ruizarguesonis]|uniref:DUF6197 family protein n=1 Tax=Rhizobium ruizarguesonis TaxID=2081791 RepID=UPI00163B5D1F|nr:hypothetical protein [Rhizobium ruizarguesonis]MBC2806583.1 hypothetical protein [Rhizobium ruizarguesonis]
MTPHEILAAGRELLSNPDHWTKGAPARDRKGESIIPYDPKATCFCTIGAIHKVVGPQQLELKRQVVGYLIEALDTGHKVSAILSAFNDHPKTSHDQVLELWDKAIEIARH